MTPGRSTTILQRLAVMALGVVMGLVVIGAGVVIFHVDVPRLVYRARQVVWPDKVLWIHRLDPVLGYGLVPYAAVRHTTELFDVTYHIGADGARVVPGAPEGRPIVELLGDSWTFGHGVADDATYAALLQQAYGDRLTVRNRAVMGYGTVQAMLTLEQDLATNRPIAEVLYGWLWFHNHRNSLRRSNLDVTAGGKVPRIEVVDGRPVDRGLAGKESAIPDDSPGLDESEWRITEAALRRMDALSRQHGATFVVLILPDHPDAPPEQQVAVARLTRFLDGAGISYRNVGLDPAFHTATELFYPLDSHPRPEWHARVARYVLQQLPVADARP